MTAKVEGLELKLEGSVTVDSGELLIADPCYLEDFYFDSEPLDKPYSDKLHEMRQAEIALLRKGAKEIKEICNALDDCKKSEVSARLIKITVSTKAARREKEKSIERLRQELKTIPMFAPSYFAQGPGYVVFRNPIGDGTYPVVQMRNGLRVVFDVPLKRLKDHTVVTDEKRLEGKLLGHAGVDSGELVIVDAARFSPKPDKREDDYCTIKMESGVYICKFVKNNYAVSLKKA